MGTNRIHANGVEFLYLELGTGPLVLLVHGFPDTPHSFRSQMKALAEAGYRAVAPYLRGCWPTGFPEDGCFSTAALARDIISLIQALSDAPAVVYGHDWGARAAYGAAVLCPGHIRRLVVSSVPYGPLAARLMKEDYDQLKRHWYHFFFQLPLAERVLTSQGHHMLERLWRDWSPGWEPPPDLLIEVRKTFLHPEVVSAVLAHYRCRWGTLSPAPHYVDDQRTIDSQPPIAVDTLYLHGNRDACIGIEITEGMESSFTGKFKKLIVQDAGHFVHVERADVVNHHLLEFLQDSGEEADR